MVKSQYLVSTLLALCHLRQGSAANPSHILFSSFESADIPNAQGCPLAALWSVGGSFPFDSVQGPLRNATNVSFSEPSNCTSAEFDAIAEQIQLDYANETVDGPGSNRALFHSAGTFSAVAGAGGLGGVDGGWLQFPENVAFPANAGLDETVEYIKGLVQQFPCITFADAVVFNGVIVTELAGGPAVAFMPGRRDASTTPTNPVLPSRLPDGSYNTAGVLSYYTQMGLSERELAVFNGGGHSLGGAHPENSGWNGSFTYASDKFPTPKNLYFIQTFENEWRPQIVVNSTTGTMRFQFVLLDSEGNPENDADGNYIIRIPSDTAILLGGERPTAWAYSYAKDEDLFMNDYARVLQRISQLGAGESWFLNPDQYVWLGVNGTATNYGTNIEPQFGDPPIPTTDMVYPSWLKGFLSGPTMTLEESVPSTQKTAAPSSSSEETPAVPSSSSRAPSLSGQIISVTASALTFFLLCCSMSSLI